MNARDEARAKARSSGSVLGAGVFLLAVCCALGTVAGFVLKAAQDQDGNTDYMTKAATGGGFNWFLFSLFVAVGVLLFGIAAVASEFSSTRS